MKDVPFYFFGIDSSSSRRFASIQFESFFERSLFLVPFLPPRKASGPLGPLSVLWRSFFLDCKPFYPPSQCTIFCLLKIAQSTQFLVYTQRLMASLSCCRSPSHPLGSVGELRKVFLFTSPQEITAHVAQGKRVCQDSFLVVFSKSEFRRDHCVWDGINIDLNYLSSWGTRNFKQRINIHSIPVSASCYREVFH